MSPRNYDMSKRAAAAAQTRRRIVEATLQLHGERGVAATRWEDIAARAGVGVGTVYRHFPSLDELVPACGDVAMELVGLPDPAGARGIFDGAAGAPERLGRLVREAFAIYERGAPALRAIRRDAGVHARIAQDLERVEAALAALVDAALVDLDAWDAFRAQGLEPAECVEVVSDLLARRISP